MKTKKILGLIFISSLILASCKKEDQTLDPNIDNNNNQAQASAADLSNSFKLREQNATQTFSIDAASTQVVNGSKGGSFTFYANSFVTMSGQPVTGNVDIQLVEVYEKADMILMNKPTMGRMFGGQLAPLTSGGEFKILASQGGQQLRLAPFNSFSATIPAPGGVTDPNMQVFLGDTTTDTLVWNQDDSTQLTTDSSGTSYFGFFDDLGWINCDYFWNDPSPKTNVDVEIPAGYDNTTCMLFVSFDGLNSITSFYNYSNQVYSSGPAYELPIGLNVHFILLAYVNGVPQSAIVPATITNNHYEIVASLNPTTVAQLAIDINNLP